MFTRAFQFVKALRGKYLLLLFFFTLFLTFTYVALSLRTSAQVARDDMQRQIGAYLQFEPNHEGISANGEVTIEPLSTEVIEQIRAIDHVLGIDPFNSDTFAVARPGNFVNSKKHEGVNPEEETNEAIPQGEADLRDSVVLFGLPDIAVRDEFRRDFSRIVSGRMPANEGPEAIITKELADTNGISLGDKVSFTTIEDEPSNWELTIVGIYDTDLVFRILPSNIFGQGVFSYSPYNRIYTNYAMISEVLHKPADITFGRVFVDANENIPYVEQKIRSLAIPWDTYKLTNGTEGYYQTFAFSINQVFRTSGNILYYTIGGILLLSLLLSLLWSRSESYELGVYLSLGEKKKKIIMESFCRYWIIGAIAFVISLGVGSLFLTLLVRNTPAFQSVQDLFVSETSFYTGEFVFRQNLQLVFRWENILILILALGIIILLFNLRTIWLLLSKSPSEIVAKTIEE